MSQMTAMSEHFGEQSRVELLAWLQDADSPRSVEEMTTRLLASDARYWTDGKVVLEKLGEDVRMLVLEELYVSGRVPTS